MRQLLCYPLDNTEYEANALGAWCGTRTRGVFAAEGHYNVTPNGDMTVTVSPGIAWLKADDYWGVVVYEANSTILTLSTADGVLNRIDAICVRLNKNQNKAEFVVKKGMYSHTPVIVAPARDIDYDEIYIATVLVKSGMTVITALDINDQRLNENYCGLMRDGVTGISTQMLYDQWISFMNTIQNLLNENVAGNLQNQVNRYKSRQANVTLAASDWVASGSVYVATKAVGIVPAHCTLHAGPAWASQTAYQDAEVCVSAATLGSVTFTAARKPSVPLTVNVAVSEVDA